MAPAPPLVHTVLVTGNPQDSAWQQTLHFAVERGYLLRYLELAPRGAAAKDARRYLEKINASSD